MYVKETIRIDAPVEEVDRLSLPPEAWPKYVRGMDEPDAIAGDGGPGTTVSCDFHPPGSPRFRMTTRVLEYDHGIDGTVHWYAEFCEGCSGWQEWELRPSEGGTCLTQAIDWSPADGTFASLAARLFARRPFRRNVRASLQSLKRLAEAEAEASPSRTVWVEDRGRQH